MEKWFGLFFSIFGLILDFNAKFEILSLLKLKKNIVYATKYCVYRVSFSTNSNRNESLFVIQQKNITFHMHKYYILEIRKIRQRSKGRQAGGQRQAVLQYSITCHSKLENFQCNQCVFEPFSFANAFSVYFVVVVVAIAILSFFHLNKSADHSCRLEFVVNIFHVQFNSITN